MPVASPDPVIYFIRHDTAYDYDQPVGESRQLLRLTPRELPWQQVRQHGLQIDPEPAWRASFLDGFGNVCESMHLERDHSKLHLRAESWVSLMPRGQPDLAASPAWEQVRETLAYAASKALNAERLEACAFVHDSTYVRLNKAYAEYARQDFVEGSPVLAATHALMCRIKEEFTFDPEATDISTPVAEVFEKRRGVCQDFAHFMLACLRSLGLPARYMSGYILTHPPAGRERLIGADATHAWIAVYCPMLGWVEFDPTNALIPDTEHVTLGWGHDFADVSPMRGVILGGGGHLPAIAVTMVPEAEYDALFGDALQQQLAVDG